MIFFKQFRHFLSLFFILLLAGVLIFFRLDRADMINDDAIYSFRSIGYVDYVLSEVQTTPLQWFDDLPGWARLSMHDGPPLVELIQYLFFSIFGDSVIVARLPFALAGLGSILLAYLLLVELKDKRTALLGSLLLTVLNYHIWISRVGYLEGIAGFFIILNLYLFVKAKTNKNYYWWWGVTLGLALLTKYTTIFLIPMYMVYWLITERSIFKKWELYAACGIALVLFSPVIIFNWQMFETRGHLDVQLSALFGQGNDDWPILGTTIQKNYFNSLLGINDTLVRSLGFPLAILFYLALLYLAINNFIYRQRRYMLLFLGVGFLSLQFILIGSGVRFLALYNIFIVSFSALFILEIYERVPTKFKPLYQVATALFIMYLAIFAINTNLLYTPYGQPGIAYSDIRIGNSGYNNLENYINELINDRKPGVVNDFWGYSELDEDVVPNWSNEYLTEFFKSGEADDFFPALFIYDENTVWFAQLWYFERRKFYDNYPFIRLSDFLRTEQKYPGFFDKHGYRAVYFIKATDKPMLEVEKYRTELSDLFAKQLEERGIAKVEIKNHQDEVVFIIYEMVKS